MRKLLLIAVFLVAGLFASTTFAQGGGWHQHNGHWHNHYHTRYHYHNNVGYRPVVQWFPSGTYLNVGPVHVSPDRRYVRMGINVGFSQVRGYSTFNYYTGQTRYYPPRR